MEKIELPVSERMVNQTTCGLGSEDWASRPGERQGYAQHMLRRIPLNGAQFAHTIHCVNGSDAVNAAVTIGSIGCVQLIAAPYPLDPWKNFDGVLNGESEIPGNSKYFRDSEFL
jgi:hypothetical protein